MSQNETREGPGPINPNDGKRFVVRCVQCRTVYYVTWWHFDVSVSHCDQECLDAHRVRGMLTDYPCANCHGEGKLLKSQMAQNAEPCDQCNGTGKERYVSV